MDRAMEGDWKKRERTRRERRMELFFALTAYVVACALAGWLMSQGVM